MKIENNISLKAYNTFGLDVKAGSYAEVHDAEDLQQFIRQEGLQSGDYLILGGGSNLLFTGDYDGLVIRNCIKGINVEEIGQEKVLVTAGAGVVWDDLVQYCVGKGYGGIENLVLIPGSAGAGPIQNIGAYGVELKDCFHSLEAIDAQTGSSKVFTPGECEFGYRDSIFKRGLKGKYIIVSLSLMLHRNHRPDISYGAIKQELVSMEALENAGIMEVAKAITSIRKRKLPDPVDVGNAGSFFKNPVITKVMFDEIRNRFPGIPSYKEKEGFVKVPAAWLIEKCGWKGRQSGNAAVHDKQALVLVNKGGAEGRDILSLAKRVRASVFDEFGIDLEFEVNII